MGKIRQFSTGATRDTAEDKLEPWGFTSALVEKAFSEYMHGNRKQSDGQLRDSDNWKKGIPLDAYWHSLSRHVLDFRLLWEEFPEETNAKGKVEALCGVRFNTDGLLYEILRAELRGLRLRDIVPTPRYLRVGTVISEIDIQLFTLAGVKVG